MSGILAKLGFHQTNQDPCLYIRGRSYLLLYIDDALVVTRSKGEIGKITESLGQQMKIHYEGPVTCFLALDIVNKNCQFVISQTRYIQNLA